MGAPTGLQIAGWGCLWRFWDPSHLGTPPGLLRSLPTRCCSSIAFMLRRVRPALLWDFSGSRTLSTLVYPVPALGTSTGSRTPAVSPASGSGAAPLPVPRTRRRTHLDVRGSANPGSWAPRGALASSLRSPPSPTFAATLAWLQLEVGHPCPAKTLLLGSSGASFHQPCGLYPLPLGGVAGVWG